MIIFKARISIYFPWPENKAHLDAMSSACEGFVSTPCQLLKIQYKKEPFFYYPEEADEAAGNKYDGVYFVIERELKQLNNYYNLSKIFDGLTGMIDLMHDICDHAEFDLIP